MKVCILMKFILYYLEMSPLLIFIIIIGLISIILQNLAKRPCKSDENTYWFQSHSNFPILETESFNKLFESNSFQEQTTFLQKFEFLLINFRSICAPFTLAVNHWRIEPTYFFIIM